MTIPVKDRSMNALGMGLLESPHKGSNSTGFQHASRLQNAEARCFLGRGSGERGSAPAPGTIARARGPRNGIEGG